MEMKKVYGYRQPAGLALTPGSRAWGVFNLKHCQKREVLQMSYAAVLLHKDKQAVWPAFEVIEV